MAFVHPLYPKITTPPNKWIRPSYRFISCLKDLASYRWVMVGLCVGSMIEEPIEALKRSNGLPRRRVSRD